MRKYYYFALKLIALVLLANVTKAQTTGSFDVSITYASQARTLSMYVPASYNSANPARLMVCLHGLGDNSTNYRNALINLLGMQNTFTNTIFVCPDGGSDQIKDFYTPAGDEFIIDSSIAYVMANYNIDQSYMILQGFSLGGRSALRYGLTYPGMFKGLLLNTPAIQGTKEAVFQNGYAYANATHMPIYVSHGAIDEIYANPIDSAVLMLIKDTANLRMNRVAGLGHSVPSMSQMPGLDTFFDVQTATTYDIDLVEVRTPVHSCQAQYNISCLFRNVGSLPVTSVDIEYTINGVADTITWTGNINSFEPAMLNIPATATAATSAISVKVLTINGAIPDAVTSNNEKSTSFLYYATPAPLTFSEGFESTNIPAGWVHETAGDIISAWEVDDIVAYNSNSSMFAFNTILVFDNSGRRETLYSPTIDLSGTTNPEMTFDVTFNYHRYTPPYFTDTVNFSDTLEVAVSPDCGATWQVLYKKAGPDLATFAAPIYNVLNINNAYQDPADSNWRKEHIPLSSVAGNNDVMVRISYISGLGGWINLDNVNITPTVGVNDIRKNIVFEVFPNPAHGQVTLKADEQMQRITVTDMQGKVVATATPMQGSKDVTLSTASWALGVYMVQLQTADGIGVKKLVVE